MVATLLRTKLHPPYTRRGLVYRPRLMEQITQGLVGPLTLIAAPAGFGKTTLAASCTTISNNPVAWFSLDSDDNQLDRFFGYLVAALQEVDPSIGKEAAQLLAAAGQVPQEAILTSIMNDLDAANGEFILVLDDYQFIINQVVHDVMSYLLDHCPDGFHLVVASRSDPPLPVARLRARGQVVELRADQLRFTESEAAQFLNEVMGLGLDAAAVAALEERTEGWVAGLQMAAISMRDHKDIPGFIAGFSGTNRFILDYLLEEILDSLPLQVQDFLLYTSILNRLSAPVCDHILTMSELPTLDYDRTPDSQIHANISPSAAVLDYMEQANLFLMPLDDKRTWYRYHHLFADLLRARLQQAQPELISLLHIRAADWLEQAGFISEAVNHLVAADNINRAAELIESYGPIRLAENDPSLLYMAETFPQDEIVSRPKLGLYLAWLLIVQGRIPKALPLLKSLAQLPAVTELDSEQQWMRTVAAAALAFLAPLPSAPEFPLPDFQQLDAIPTEELILRNAAEFLNVMALGRRGELERAAEVAAKCVEREKNVPGAQAIPTLAPFLTRIYVILGRLREAASVCYEFLDPAKEENQQFLHSPGTIKIDLGEVLYEWNHLKEAEQHIRDGLQDNEAWRNIMTDGFGLVALTRTLQAKGDYAEALRTIEKFQTRLQTQSQPREFFEDLLTLRVRVELASGDLENPSRWAEQIVLSEEYHCNPAVYRLTLARIRHAQGRFADVEQLLSGTAPPIAAGSHVSRQLESDLLLAAAIAGQGRVREALLILDEVLATAEPQGYIRVFLDVGETARDLLIAYLRSADPRHELYAQKLLDAFSLSAQIAAPDRQAAVLIEPLTEREIEVLGYIALGRTNKEIAQELVVAPGTIKAHTASIYRKLEVTNRTEAAARARQIGILP